MQAFPNFSIKVPTSTSYVACYVLIIYNSKSHLQSMIDKELIVEFSSHLTTGFIGYGVLVVTQQMFLFRVRKTSNLNQLKFVNRAKI